MSVLTVEQVRDRKETDISDPGVQALIDTAEGDIIARYGPYRDADDPEPITEDKIGNCRRIFVARPVDPDEAVTVTETAGTAVMELADDDYQTWNGRWFERLHTGTNPKWEWAPKVTIAYVPIDDTVARSEVAIKLVILSIEYEGVIERDVGDVRTTHGLRSASGGGSPLVYVDERQRLLETLAPPAGVMIR